MVSPGAQQLPARLPISSISTVLNRPAPTALPSGLKSCRVKRCHMCWASFLPRTLCIAKDYHHIAVYSRHACKRGRRRPNSLTFYNLFLSSCLKRTDMELGDEAYLQPDSLPGNSVRRVKNGCEGSAAAAIAASQRAGRCTIRECAPLAAPTPGACILHAVDKLPDRACANDCAPDCD